MDRSKKSSNISSSIKLEPLYAKTKTTLNQSNTKLKYTPRAQSFGENENSLSSLKNVTNLIQKQDVQDLERKILDFDAKDDGSIPSKHLFNLRRSYDEISKQLVRKELDINHLKGEIEVMKRTINISRESEDASKRNVDDLWKNLNSVKEKQTTEQMNTKSLEQMIDRMRKDEVVHKTRITVLDKKVKNIEASIRDSEIKGLEIGEQQSTNLVSIEQVRQQYRQTTKQRIINFQLYQGLILKKQGIQMQQQERMRVTENIQAMASSDINDAHSLKYKKLLMVHGFLRRVLKSKIMSIEEKYYDIKKSYNTIQVKTSVNDPRQLSRAYFETQVKYKQYLEEIRELEVKQKQLNGQKQELEKQWKSLQVYEYGEQDDRDALNTQSNKKAAELLGNHWLKIHLIQIRMKNFILSCIKRLNACKGHELNGDCKSGQYQDLANSSIQFCQRLLLLSKQLEDKQQQTPHFQSLKQLEVKVTRDLLQVDEEQKQDKQGLRSKQ